MQLDKGELYFVRERDFHTKQFTNFVKIGLVREREGRSSFDRLSEHQTGNPRRLELPEGNVVFTDAINRVEAQMHNVFAKNRVSGEWFEFNSEEDIESAMSKAAELATQVASYKDLFMRAEQLDDKPSVAKPKEVDASISEIAKNLQVAKSEIKILDELGAEISGLFIEAVEAGKDTKGAAKTTSRSFQGKFDKEQFESENPEVFTKYLFESKKWNHSFLFKLKALGVDDLSTEFREFVQSTKGAISDAKASERVEDLNEVILSISHKKALSDWDAELATAELKNACGDSEAITGICTWKRFESATTSFSESKLKADLPDLYSSYLGEGTEKTYVRPTKVKLK